MTTTDPTTLEDALHERLLDVARALDETVRAINTIRGVLEVGCRDLDRQAEKLRELSPGMLDS